MKAEIVGYWELVWPRVDGPMYYTRSWTQDHGWTQAEIAAADADEDEE